MSEVHVLGASEGYEIVAPPDWSDAWEWPDGEPQLNGWTLLEVFIYDQPYWEVPFDIERWRSGEDDAAYDELDLYLPADCASMGNGKMVCRDNVADVGRSALEAYGEFLPLWEPLREERLWMFNPLVVADVPDEERSDIRRGQRSGRITQIRWWIFHEDRLAGLGAFLIPQTRRLCLTGEPLRKLQAASLGGLVLHRVWLSTDSPT